MDGEHSEYTSKCCTRKREIQKQNDRKNTENTFKQSLERWRWRERERETETEKSVAQKRAYTVRRENVNKHFFLSLESTTCLAIFTLARELTIQIPSVTLNNRQRHAQQLNNSKYLSALTCKAKNLLHTDKSN